MRVWDRSRAERLLRLGRIGGVQAARWLWQRAPLSPRVRQLVRRLVYQHAVWLLPESRRPLQRLSEQRAQIELPAPRDLPLPEPPAEPRLSIIVPVHNALAYTRACLDTLAQQADARITFDVIVVDDASTDGTAQMLSQRDDLVYLRNDPNRGFLHSCNRGAAAARGALLLFLNNDALLQHNALLELVRTFDAVPGCGLAGAQLCYPDGRLQEAGGIVWQDGSAWNWGRFDDPDRPRYSFLRDVDYCSGAAIAVRRDLFDALDGFDARFAPAYYEDTDLAFQIRKLGYRTVYQPCARAWHFEGISSGTDENRGAKAHQKINRIRFRDKWQSVLRAHEPFGARPEELCDRRIVGRVLIIDATTPTPDRDSGSLDLLNYMRILLNAGYRVTFIPDHTLAHAGRYTDDLGRLGVECLHRPYLTDTRTFIRKHGNTFNCVLFVRAEQAHHYATLFKRCWPHVRRLFLTVDLHYLRLQRQAELESSRALQRRADAMQRIELDAMHACDATIVLSEAERERLVAEGVTAQLAVIPIVRELSPRQGGYAGRRDLLFVGNFAHAPNVDAIVWFLDAIWPRIAEALPDAHCHIVGSNAPEAVARRAGGRVQLHGFVADLSGMLARCRLTVAPLRYGAGQKGKIVTSLEHGVPCVTTSIGAEGMGAAEQALAVADTADTFARSCVALYSDPERWERCAAAGHAALHDIFSLETNATRLLGLLTQLRCAPFDMPCPVCGLAHGFAQPARADWLTEPACAACGTSARLRSLAQAVLASYGGEMLDELPVGFNGTTVGGDFPWDARGWNSASELDALSDHDRALDALVLTHDTELDASAIAALAARLARGGVLAIALDDPDTLTPAHRRVWLDAARDAGLDARFAIAPLPSAGVLQQALFVGVQRGRNTTQPETRLNTRSL